MSGWKEMVVVVAVLVEVVVVVVVAEHNKTNGDVWSDSADFSDFKWTPLDYFRSRGHSLLTDLPTRLFLHERGDVKKEQRSWGDIPGTYLPSTNSSIVENAQCRSDVDAFLRVVTDYELLALVIKQEGSSLWPLKLPDSWGKVPDGIMYGNVLTWGVMEECTRLMVNTTIENPLLDVHFRGRYCLVKYRNKKGATTTQQQQQQKAVQSLQHNIQEIPQARMGSLLSVSPFPLVSYGTCMPSSCTPSDLLVSIEAVLGNYSSDLTVDCHTKDEIKWLNAGDVVFIVFLGIIGSVLLFATVADVSSNFYKKQELRKGPLRFLLVFSVSMNLKKIFHINVKEGPHVISCLHGIRAMSMVWVVWGHSYFIDYRAVVNVVYAAQLTDNVFEQTIMGGNFSVDSFFLMSGLLVMYGVLKEYNRANKINWLKYYIHRYVRLTPPILLTGAATATIARFVLVGPEAGSVERAVVDVCRENWWRDILYISNLPNIMKSCLPQCWYVCVDLQLYLVAPLVLLPLLHKPKIGMIWMGVVTIIAMVIPMIILGVYSIPTNLVFGHPAVEAKAYVDTYGKPWCRAGVYLVGMWGGMFLHHYKDRHLKLKMWQTVVGWLLAATLALLVVYGIADYNTLVNYKPITLGIGITYDILSRMAWGIAVLWVIVACHKGYGGPINTFLSHPSWQPLSRLTFSMYLVAFMVQSLYVGVIYTPMYFNHLNQFIQTCGMLFISGIIAVIISLISEGPIIGLEKILLGS
ncbi:hypothetical protein Pmani_012596 [Petrolisthes manimaculis]|uniref:Nose resistant-to-fluoxetine protein N-terminal domain-containing protein n=1 Tax=Petrolisthes manimaculis TaxID=1843537 RepID=A0AAE1UEX9_9EUCA|nr:hypothetical protein Pmani_012596 [Petrolisthes manimaculis]